MNARVWIAAMWLLVPFAGARTWGAALQSDPGPGNVAVTVNQASLLGPPRDGGPAVVRAAFHLEDIDEIDDEAETFEFTGILTLTWTDKRQAFDPDLEQVEEKIYQGNYQFNELSPAWYPQVVLANESGLFETNAVLLRVKPDGTSTLVQTVSAVAEAKLNLRRYPFDSQHLDAIFEILGFGTTEVVLEAETLPTFSDSLQKVRMPQWTLTNVSTTTRERAALHAGSQGTASALVLTIDVRRQSLYMLRLVVVPLTLIVVLSWSVFWMDRSSLGDRINVSFIGILTAVAYQFVVGGILPQISYVTLMDGFLNISFLVMCATVVINLIVGDMDKRGNSERGDLIDRRCRWIFPCVYFGSLLTGAMVSLQFL